MGEERVLRPGQEAVLAEMLGRGEALPGPCTFTGGRVDGGLVAATYTCPEGEVVVELHDPTHAQGSMARTEKFAIEVRGPAPSELVEALQARILPRELDLAWSQPMRDRGVNDVSKDGGQFALVDWVVVFAVVIVGTAAAVALGRAWRRGGFSGAVVAARRGARRTLAVFLSVVAAGLLAEAAYRIKLAVDVPGYAAGAAFELYGVGESTMVGEPYAPKISVPRILEHMFGGVIAGRPMVIRNIAESGVPLYPQAAAFERALAARQAGAPGVVLILSGHNEGFLPPVSGPPRPFVPSLITDRSAIVRDVLLALRRRRLIGRERSPAVYEYYLRQVIETALANGLLPILTTMASNISRIEPNADSSTADAVVATVAEGRALESQQRYAEARDLYLSRLAADSWQAVLHYRAGRCEEALGNFAAAYESYWTAVDRDPRLLFGRATRLQNQLVRQLAGEYGVPLVDAVRIFEDHSSHGLLGDDLFMDGQHPAVAGYLHLANAYARILSERFDTPVRQPLRDEHEVAVALGFGPRDSLGAFVGSGSWLIATSVGHPFPQDRMALAEKRFRAVLGKGDDFSGWMGIGLAQATVRGGLLRSPDEVRALGGLVGYPKAYSVPPEELPSLLARFQKFGVDELVIEKLKTLPPSSAQQSAVPQSSAPPSSAPSAGGGR